MNQRQLQWRDPNESTTIPESTKNSPNIQGR